jgi:hypothetical protein
MDLAELGRLADDLEVARQNRLAADKIAASLKSEENSLKAQLIAEMEENNLSSVGGESCIVKRTVKQRAIAADWTQIYGYILEHDAFDLLHKRLTDSAILLRKEDGVEVPGVTLMDYSNITYSKAPK